MNHFKIIIPLYNVEKWIKKCIRSIQLQTYDNYECYLIDDMSTDNTKNIIESLIQGDNRFTLIENKVKKFALRNIYEAIQSSGSDPEDIIVTLDGDDFLATKSVLDKLSRTYDDYRCLMTYGSYIEYPSKQKGAFCRQIPQNIIKSSTYRNFAWLSSHLRTFKRSLWDKINVEDLQDEDHNFYRMTWDMAFMFPMLEMSGPLAVHISDILYVYNRENPINDDKVNHKLQIETEHKIRGKEKYPQNFVSCNILGPGEANSGIGNQLFCIANALSYSKDSGKRLFLPQILNKKDVLKYKETFYTNLNIGLDADIYDTCYTETDFSYTEIPELTGNVLLNGYFQSDKYFAHNRKHILESFDIDTLQYKVTQEYGDYSDYISIHVRRGDYLHLKEYHGVLDIEYYKNSIQHFGDHQKYIVFSDDIEWCKRSLTFVGDVLYSNCKEDWEDLILMSTCKAHIIANSTFSWWSAWLSGNETIAPNIWFTLDDKQLSSKDLYPTKWRRM